MLVFLVEFYMPAGGERLFPAEVFASRDEAREAAASRLKGAPHCGAVIIPVALPHAEAHAEDNGKVERVSGTA